MFVLLIIWCGFWGALAAALGAGTSLALLVAFGSVLVPLAVLVLVAIVATLIEDAIRRRGAKRRRAAFEARRRR